MQNHSLSSPGPQGAVNTNTSSESRASATSLASAASASAGSGVQSMPAGPVVLDVAGLELAADEIARLQHPLTGGVILFARNFADRDQLTALCAAIREARPGPLLICTDHEGGRVQRFRADGFTPLPSMRSLGRCYDAEPSQALHAAIQLGFVLASELRACGVDLSFAPVLDLDYGASSVIGDRSLHAQAQVVALLAGALALGMARAGMAACGKHFPGHGAVREDTHTAIAEDHRSLAEILDNDIMPYRYLGTLGLPAIMPAHVIYPSVAPEPAGFSPFWINNILRSRLSYDGLVFSDDLTMQAASVAGDITARARAALQAGCDMVLVCNRPDLADELLQGLSDHVVQDSLGRRLQRLWPTRPAPDWQSLLSDPLYLYARSIQSAHLSV